MDLFDVRKTFLCVLPFCCILYWPNFMCWLSHSHCCAIARWDFYVRLWTNSNSFVNFFILSFIHWKTSENTGGDSKKRKYEFIAKDPQMIVSLSYIFLAKGWTFQIFKKFNLFFFVIIFWLFALKLWLKKYNLVKNVIFHLLEYLRIFLTISRWRRAKNGNNCLCKLLLRLFGATSNIHDIRLWRRFWIEFN